MHLTLSAVTTRKKPRLKEAFEEFTARLGHYVTSQQEQFVSAAQIDSIQFF